MRLALIHPDAQLAAALAGLADPDARLCWSETQADAAVSRPSPEYLLLAATLSTPARVRYWRERGAMVVLLTPRAGSEVDAVYAALDAGAQGQLVLADASGLPELLQRLKRWRTLQPPPRRPELPPLIALGASAGGPQALAGVLATLPTGLSAAVVVALHYASESARELAHWLQQACRLPVQVAIAGEAPRPGRVAVADAGRHLELDADGGWHFSSAGRAEPLCPSVDRLFLSLAAHARPGSAALLSGMGSDGAAGLLALRRAGWFTVAQDAGSSRVYGMPRAAAEAGAAVQVLPLAQIADALLRGLPGRESA